MITCIRYTFCSICCIYCFAWCFIHAAANCFDIPDIQNGELHLENHSLPFSVGDSIPYLCKDGYVSEGKKLKVECVERAGNATWVQPSDTCRPRSCGYPGDIENSHRIGNLFTFPNNVTYLCNEGYRLYGSSVLYCTASGVWKPHLPSCEAIVCPLLSHPENGKIVSSERRYNSVARYECNRNFFLKGNATRVCQADTTWSGSIPSCHEITCSDPGPLENGRIIPNLKVYRSGQIIIFQCNDSKQSLSSKCMEDGEWNVRPPLCKGPESTKTANISITSSTKQFIPFETSTKEPTSNKLNSCADPGNIRNGKREITGFSFNSTVTYSCEEGYNLRGQGTLICLKNGKWNLDKLPICVKPIPVVTIIGCVVGIFLIVLTGVSGYFLYQWRERKLRGYGKNSKALTADATDLEEITGLDKGKKPIPVTVL